MANIKIVVQISEYSLHTINIFDFNMFVYLK